MKEKEYHLVLNESARLSSAFFVEHRIIYAGMPNDKTYSLAISRTYGYQSRAHNIFIPLSQKEIVHEKGKIVVYSVTPLEINFKIEPW